MPGALHIIDKLYITEIFWSQPFRIQRKKSLKPLYLSGLADKDCTNVGRVRLNAALRAFLILYEEPFAYATTHAFILQLRFLYKLVMTESRKFGIIMCGLWEFVHGPLNLLPLICLQ